MYKFNAFLFIGPPGAGKSTAGHFFEKHGDFLHFSTGEYFESLKNKVDLSENERLAVEDMTNGIYVRKGLPEKLFHNRLLELIAEEEYDPDSQILISDVIPRTLAQIEPVEKFVKFQRVFYFFISDDYMDAKKEAINRINGRARNLKDEDVEKVVKRLKEYYAEGTDKVVEYYRDQGIVTEVCNNKNLALYLYKLNDLFKETIGEFDEAIQ